MIAFPDQAYLCIIAALAYGFMSKVIKELTYEARVARLKATNERKH